MPELDAHMLDILAGAAHVVSEKRQAAPRSGYCQPDITILNSSDEPLVFIEVVHTHPPDKSVVVARELGIPVFVIPAPRETLVRPTLGAARPWWEFVPGFLDDEVNREMARAYESYVESRIAGPAQELEWYAEHETIVDDDGASSGRDSEVHRPISPTRPTPRSEPHSWPTIAPGAASRRRQRLKSSPGTSWQDITAAGAEPSAADRAAPGRRPDGPAASQPGLMRSSG